MKAKAVIILLICTAALFAGANLLMSQDSTATGTDLVFETPFQISIAADFSSITVGGYTFAFPGWFILVMGFLFPIIYQPITRLLKTDTAKAWATVGLSIIFGTIGSVLAGVFSTGFELHNLPYFLIAVFGFSVLSYYAWWKKLFKSPLGKLLNFDPVKSK